MKFSIFTMVRIEVSAPRKPRICRYSASFRSGLEFARGPVRAQPHLGSRSLVYKRVFALCYAAGIEALGAKAPTYDLLNHRTDPQNGIYIQPGSKLHFV
jgi:hypothetical protein